MSLTQPSVDDVRALITTALTDAQVSLYIEDATLIAEGCSGISELGETRQAAIVKWLTAHLIAQQTGKGGQVTAEKLGDASKSFAAGAGGLFLQSTRYGQQAAMLDTTGGLANLGKVRAICEIC